MTALGRVALAGTAFIIGGCSDCVSNEDDLNPFRLEGGTMMFPAQYAWLEPVIVGAIIVFVIDLIGNMLSFSSRIMNALVTALVFAAVFGALLYTGIGRVEVRSIPGATVPLKK